MRIKSSILPKDLLDKIKNPDPIEGEDIVIEDDDGNMVGVIIQPKAYEFFIKAIEEREDEIDKSLDEPFDPSAPSLDDLRGE